jgi:hypothetical protein
VANAIPALKERVDHVTTADHGAGVTELIGALLDDDLESLTGRLGRHHLALASRNGGAPVTIPPYGAHLLIAGPSGSGKALLAANFLQSLSEHQYQFCVIDPEADYQGLAGAVTLGSSHSEPTVEEILDVLAKPNQNAVVNLLGVAAAERPAFALGVLARLQEMRLRTGRPHWLVLDEAHHLLPTSWKPAEATWPTVSPGTLLITPHADHVAAVALRPVKMVIALGQQPRETLEQFCRPLGDRLRFPTPALEPGEALLWERTSADPPYVIRVAATKAETERRSQKYTEGALSPEASFYFRGPDGKLNLRAQNLRLFLQMADGVDDDTWMHHLRGGDYSRWFREALKDQALAREAEELERRQDLKPHASRQRMRDLIARHYPLPAS